MQRRPEKRYFAGEVIVIAAGACAAKIIQPAAVAPQQSFSIVITPDLAEADDGPAAARSSRQARSGG
jgi:hypothetical protein